MEKHTIILNCENNNCVNYLGCTNKRVSNHPGCTAIVIVGRVNLSRFLTNDLSALKAKHNIPN